MSIRLSRIKSYIIIAIFITVICNCKNEKPANAISEADMVNILARIHIAEAKVSNAYMQSDTAKMYYALLEDSLFTKYNVTKAHFNASLQYYIKDQVAIDRIYAGVVDTLGFWESIGKIN